MTPTREGQNAAVEGRKGSVSPKALSRLPSQFCVEKSLLKGNNDFKKNHNSSLAAIGEKGKRGEQEKGGKVTR